MINSSIISHNLNTNKPLKTLNLSQLLDKKLLPTPQAIMSDRLKAHKAKKNQEHHENFKQTQGPTIPDRKPPLKINYQHYRSKSSSKIKNYYDSVHSPFQKKVNLQNLSDKNKSQILLNNRRHSTPVNGQSLQNSYKSQQISANNSGRSKNFAFRQQLYAAKKNQANEAMLIMSLEYQKSMNQLSKNDQIDEARAKSKRKYLKKGSSIQKQIVCNLLKNKIIKEHEDNVRKQYTEHDILSMVKLYKGFLGFPNYPLKNPELMTKLELKQKSNQRTKRQITQNKSQKLLQTRSSFSLRTSEKCIKPIVGWETQQQLVIEQLKHQKNTEITMDHSYGLI